MCKVYGSEDAVSSEPDGVKKWIWVLEGLKESKKSSEHYDSSVGCTKRERKGAKGAKVVIK